ncbi:DUF3796 domain-containing protein [Anaerotignum lactatifermentans]|uniref:DUF3796 domain-containing protein n=1 Tax=Anaerotignum lactatifermentans TaxID=160404 RepID=A0ABS2G8P8_9FIRM|nr:DUF3796 domain-containing protein [Anaerotignum lactatifermentans]MBM6829195.1 DUF3796 domain-containing protein [Anaerotignum lactatifermentans]MBM6877565.1 DUF3796 domain-containing protein [Anaerotignum lactatifermentans]MBM6950773.1 DUF3796 domain-containing protein [Anaerotignum lactatifermentans]
MFRKKFFLGFLGFLGCFAFRYIGSGDVLDLAYFGFFAFCGNFFLGRIQGDRQDERYQEDQKEALAWIGRISIAALFIIWCAGILFRNMELVFVLVVAAYALLLNLYSWKLYVLEEK